MEVSEPELRAMVREAISRHVRRDEPAVSPLPGSPLRSAHASHGLLSLVTGGDAEGRCLIEPAVACTHCGYCQSMGH